MPSSPKRPNAQTPNAAARVPPAPPRADAEPLARLVLKVTLAFYTILQLLWIGATPVQRMELPDNIPARYNNGAIVTGIGPDEKEHLLYIASLVDNRRLPRPSPAFSPGENDYVSYQAQHPPLFYAVAAPLYALARPSGALAVYLLRGLCALFGGVAIVFASRAARVAFPARPLVAVGTAPFVAFTPMFAHMTGCLSNEPMALMLGAGAWYQMARLVRRDAPPVLRDFALLGATLGVAALTRLTAFLWLPAAVFALAYALRRGAATDADAKTKAHGAPVLWGAFALCAVLPLVPWLAYNLSAYGTPIPRTFDRPLLAGISIWQYLANPSQPVQPNGFPQPIVVTPLYTALWYASTAWTPFWLLQFYLPGFPQSAPSWQALFLLMDVFALLALFLHSSKSRRGETGEPHDAGGRALLWASGASLAFCVLALLQQQFWSDWNVVNSPGRYLVVALPATSLLFLFALSTIGKRPASANAALIVAAVMFALDVYAVVLVRRFYTDNPKQDAVQRLTVR